MSLEAVQLSFAYRPSRPVLQGISLTLPPATITAVIGPNGCGKSTLLRLLMGLREPGAGRVLLDGRDVSTWSISHRAARLAYIPQASLPCFAYSAEYVVALGGFASGHGLRLTDAHTALRLVGLEDRGGEGFGNLSAGQQQRVTLARALVQIGAGDQSIDLSGKYILADEPMGAMDPASGVRTAGLLRALAARGLGVVMVVHDVSLALGFADRVVLLSAGGEVVAQGPTESTLTAAALEAVFGVPFLALSGVAGGAAGGVGAMVPVMPGR